MKIRRTCREVTRLVFESQDRTLGPIERVALRLHWLACDSCRRFHQQQRVMRLALDRWKTYRDGD